MRFTVRINVLAAQQAVSPWGSASEPAGILDHSIAATIPCVPGANSAARRNQ